ncbi:MAG: ferritin-like domain-containing protein [Solirubrobacterales bacterium]|nr:ferritin-like domain-containing protein [Solirubrobacterales bacterium]
MRTTTSKGPDQDPAKRGALQRLAEDPVSRRKFVAATGSGSALALFLAACGSDDSSTSASSSSTTTSSTADKAPTSDKSGTEAFGKGDLGIVNYALTLEYLEAAFYADVAKSGLFKGDQLALIKQFGANEQAHVGALEQTAAKLGKAAKAPKTKFPLDDAKSVVALAATVENVGAAAYLGQAALIESEEVLAAALSIHTVEARHAAVLNILNGDPITPDGAFAVPMSADEVLPAVSDFIVT